MIEWFDYKNLLQRQFTVRAKEECKLLYVTLDTLHSMSIDFVEEFYDIFHSVRLRYIKSLKLKNETY